MRLTRDREALRAICDVPSERRDHLRGATRSEACSPPSGTARAGQRALSPKTATLMVFTLVQGAAGTWRRLKGVNQLPLMIEGVTFPDGVARSAARNRAA